MSTFKWNVYLALDDVAYNAVKDALLAYKAADPKPKFESDEEMYEGIPVWAGKVFWKVFNNDFYDRVGKTPTLGGKVWHLFSLYFEEGQTQQVIDWLDRLELEYPNRVEVVAAYDYRTGLLAGQYYNEAEEVVGTPAYPVHAQAHQFMPDICDDSDPPSCTAATIWIPLLVIAGQEMF